MHRMCRTVRNCGVLILASVLTTTACSPMDARDNNGSGMEEITISYSSLTAQAGITNQSVLALQQKVSQLTKGKVKFENYFGGALLKSGEELSGVGTGLADMTLVSTPYIPKEVPVSILVNQIVSTNLSPYPAGLLQASAANLEIYFRDEMQNQWAEHNAKAIGVFTTVPYGLLCTSPVTDVASAKGKTVRVGGKVWGEELESFGMVPVAIPFNESYQALQRGVTDCLAATLPSFIDYGFVEVAKHLTLTDLSAYPGYALIINDDLWSEFSPELRQIFGQGLLEFYKSSVTMQLGENASLLTTVAEEYSLQVHHSVEIDTKVKHLQQQRTARITDSNVQGLEDTAGFVSTYSSVMNKWNEKVADVVDVQATMGDPESTPTAATFSKAAELDLEEYFRTVEADVVRPFLTN